MTTNQIAYWRLQEDKRANAAREGETYRSNVVNEEIKSATQAENKRHNEMSELLTYKTAKETERSNKAKEAETWRSNLAREDEAKRHNIKSEEIDVAKTVVDGIELIPKTITAIGKILM